jgi:citrate/tricarballylate utilization protein
MTICNACRYCEGFCAVFPAMELRRDFSDGDLTYLANLCHDCRGCYYACQYAPPHEFAVNVPSTFECLRKETFRRCAWPSVLAPLFSRNGLTVAAVTLGSAFVIGVLMLLLGDRSALFTQQTGDGAFYLIVPYPVMVVPATILGVYAALALVLSGVVFWRTGGNTGSGKRAAGSVTLSTWLQAARDALKLTYLGGGGYGCNYPDDAFSTSRRWLHHLVLYGFLLDLASRTSAALYHHVLGLHAPYSFWSVPVVLGTVGGIGLMAGTAGLLWLRRRSDTAPSDATARGLSVGFLWLLLLTSLTGLLLLAFRETAAMGTLLIVHLGTVAGLFLTLPYGKFVHAVYRYLALVRYACEQPGASDTTP